MTLTLLLALVVVLVVLLPEAMATRVVPGEVVRRLALAAVLVLSLVTSNALWALAAQVAAVVLHFVGAPSRTARVWLGVAATAQAVALGAGWQGRGEVAFWSSLVAYAVRVGIPPLHLGAGASLRARPSSAAELWAAALSASWVHLTFVVPQAATTAFAQTEWLVEAGAAMALLSALVALVQTKLRDVLGATNSVHAGVAFAALAVSGRHYGVATLVVGVTLALAMGGLAVCVEALELRAGEVVFREWGGRARAFPTLAAAFAFFAAAGFALPGTLGFVADDLLLHALWEESAVACGVVIGSSALLAVGLLRAFSWAFLGTSSMTYRAPDLRLPERLAVTTLLLLLVGLGVWPMVMVGPASEVVAPRSTAGLVVTPG